MHLYRQEGLSQQQAYDQVEILMRKRYHEWYMALAEIPWWGEGVDAQVMLYLEGCQNQVLGNLNWRWVSFWAGQCYARITLFLEFHPNFRPHSLSYFVTGREYEGGKPKEEQPADLTVRNSFNPERYFGKQTAAVRKTRAVSVLF